MRQYFYLIGHEIVGDDFRMDKVFLQKSDAISYGKRLLKKNPEYGVMLYKQLISNSSSETIQFMKQIVLSELDKTPVEQFVPLLHKY